MTDRQQIAASWTSSRLDAVQAQLRALQIDALIVPRWDAHQSEYCVAADERMAWITGFSGTWGIAIITTTHAALFVDGRYTVQAGQEVNTQRFEIRHLYKEKIEDWLLGLLPPGARIAYDPLVVNPQLLERLEQTAMDGELTLVATEKNPLDSCWTDRPAPEVWPAKPFPLSFAGESSADKRRRLAAMLQELKLDFLVDSQPDNVAWLLNLRGSDVADNPIAQSFMIVSRSGAVELFIDERKLSGARAQFELDNVAVEPYAAFAAALKRRFKSGQRVAIDPKFAPAAAVLAAQAAGAKPVVVANPLTRLKASKNPVELAGLRAASRRDSLAWVRFLSWLDTCVLDREARGAPVSEIEAEEKILDLRRELEHFVSPSFRSISAAGGNAAMCHYNAPARDCGLLRSDSIYLIDSGGQYLDGTTDTTRTLCFGPPKPEWVRHYTLVLQGHIRLATLRFPPETHGFQIDAFARAALWAEGLDYDHGTGHGVGHFLSVHEHPQRIGKDPVMAPLVAGMTITNEPGYYLAGQFGIRIENLCEIVAGTDGFLSLRDLTLVPLARQLIDTQRLSVAERAWADQYHARVRREIEPLCVHAVDSAWLARMTAPLPT